MFFAFVRCPLVIAVLSIAACVVAEIAVESTLSSMV
jgi:hypothetical protein